jgi:syntaxin 1B/2/3
MSKSNTGISSEREQYVSTKSVVNRVPGKITYDVVNPDVTQEELASALSDPSTQIFQQALLSSTRSSQARSTLVEVQSRHNDILAVERKLTELAQMFNELSVMVELQEVQIDPIMQHSENARVTIEQASERVSRATELARAVRRKKWWCLSIILIIIIIIVVVVVVTQVVNHNNNKR